MNMPNLTSATGSWIIRFAELKQSDDKTPLVAPVALSKVDPAYPPDVLRDHVEGKVTFTRSSVPTARWTVSAFSIVSIRGLMPTPCAPYRRWHFRPGTKNGEAVAVEAVVEIPFRMHPLR